MGCCCEAHLQTAVNECVKLARNGEVTVSRITPPDRAVQATEGFEVPLAKCDYCNAKPAYLVSYAVR
ncbi:hypothetical protein MUP01_12695 [Candidatus Bathyarchaeota archaeon]|nr:hypothetical protein [Candidatus Bathyarchaeota archaeon]